MPLTKDPDVAPQPGSRQGALIGLQAFFIVVALCVYGLRVYTRRVILRSLGNDDYIMGVAVVSSFLSSNSYLETFIHAISYSSTSFSSPFLTVISPQPRNTIVFPLKLHCLSPHSTRLPFYTTGLPLIISHLRPKSKTNFPTPALQHSSHPKCMHKHNPRLGHPPLLNSTIQYPLPPPLNLPLRASLHPFNLLR